MKNSRPAFCRNILLFAMMALTSKSMLKTLFTCVGCFGSNNLSPARESSSQKKLDKMIQEIVNDSKQARKAQAEKNALAQRNRESSWNKKQLENKSKQPSNFSQNFEAPRPQLHPFESFSDAFEAYRRKNKPLVSSPVKSKISPKLPRADQSASLPPSGEGPSQLNDDSFRTEVFRCDTDDSDSSPSTDVRRLEESSERSEGVSNLASGAEREATAPQKLRRNLI